MDKRNHYDRFEDNSQDSIRYNSIEEAGNEVLILTIDIGDGRKDDLYVREDDDPRILAENFCKKHKLGPDAKKLLQHQIEENLEVYIEDDVSTLLSVNKSYESRAKRSHQESVRSSLGLESENTPISNKPSPSSFDLKNNSNIESQNFKETANFRNDLKNNYGEKLYLKGIRFIEKVNQKKKSFIEERKEKEMKDTTFRPMINSKSSERRHVQEFLLKKGREKQEHIERKRGEKLEKELSVCTFSPQINKKHSREPSSSDKSYANRFMKLYENAKMTQHKIRLINEKYVRDQCPFTPDTKISKNISSKLSNLSENREKISKSRREIEEYLSSKTSNKDPVTGQKFFKPVTGRPPKLRELNNKSIGEYLYSKRSKSQDLTVPTKSQKNKLSLEQSEKILKRIKELRFKQIFEDLKPNEFERITPETVKKHCLSPKTFKIMVPLLQEMEDLNEKLNFYEFEESMNVFMKSLRPDEKSVILKTCKPKIDSKKNEFKPKINEKSMMRPKSVENLYQRAVRKQSWAKEKSEAGKKEREAAEMSECTFKPKILKYRGENCESLDNSGFEPFLPLSGSYFY